MHSAEYRAQSYIECKMQNAFLGYGKFGLDWTGLGRGPYTSEKARERGIEIGFEVEVFCGRCRLCTLTSGYDSCL